MRNAQENHALQLDEEWVELIGSARSMGLSLEDIRLFLKQANQAAAELSYAWVFRGPSSDARR